MWVVDKRIVHDAQAEGFPFGCEEIASSDEGRYGISDLGYDPLKPLKKILNIFRVAKLLF